MKDFVNKVVVITGGAQGIGNCIAEEFHKLGAITAVIDKQPRPEDCGSNLYYQGDIAEQSALEDFARMVIDRFGKVDVIVNNATPLFKGIDDCTYEEFCYAQRVGVAAPFYLVKLLKDFMPQGSSVVNISSSRDRMSQPQTESYTAAKGGIAALTHALAVSLGPKIRVNSISPGWIETKGNEWTGPDAAQQPCGRVGNPQDIAQMVLFLASARAGFITGENICIDGGMTRLMIYHGDNGWKLEQ